MAVLASAGMPPESIFNSLAKVSDEFTVEKEIANVIRDIKLMGVDLPTALKNASEYAPSTKLGAMLDGMAHHRAHGRRFSRISAGPSG